MEYTKGKTVKDLELINWADASQVCGGNDGDGDDVFLLELLACFCKEGTQRVAKLLKAALAHRDGQAIVTQAEGPSRLVALVIKEEAHALKGSAANLRLWRVAKAAEDTELPCKEMLQRENSTLEYKSMMDRYCLSPCDELSSLYHEFRDFVRFVETDAKERVFSKPDGAANLDDEARKQIESVSVVTFDSDMAPFAAFWLSGVTPSAAAAADSRPTGNMAAATSSSPRSLSTPKVVVLDSAATTSLYSAVVSTSPAATTSLGAGGAAASSPYRLVAQPSGRTSGDDGADAFVSPSPLANVPLPPQQQQQDLTAAAAPPPRSAAPAAQQDDDDYARLKAAGPLPTRVAVTPMTMTGTSSGPSEPHSGGGGGGGNIGAAKVAAAPPPTPAMAPFPPAVPAVSSSSCCVRYS